jgi:hypothetical protein
MGRSQRGGNLVFVVDPSEALAQEIAGEVVGSLVPGAGPLAQRLGGLVRAEWRRNSSTALRAAENASGLSREDFAEWIESEPRAIPLYLKILWAAGTNGHDQTLKAMGAVLGVAAQATHRGDDDGFEDAELALRAMGDLTPRHFRVLGVIAKSHLLTEVGTQTHAEFTPAYVAHRSGLHEDIAHQCLLNLTAAGLTTTVPGPGPGGRGAYPLTELGHAVVNAAEIATQ